MTGNKTLTVLILAATLLILFLAHVVYVTIVDPQMHLSSYRNHGGDVEVTVVLFSGGKTLVETPDGSRWVVETLVGAPGEKVAVDSFRFSVKASSIAKGNP